MRPRREPLTLADYLVVAICPTLIGLFVGSLMWFLVEILYQGDGKFVVLWVMSFFVLGMVSIARLSMEQGWGKASLAVLPLAGGVALHTPPVVWPILALVWWATHKLTWDSTLIDDSQDTSGQGLLDQMGLDSGDGENADQQQAAGRESVQPNHSMPPPLEATTAAPDAPPHQWWHQFLEADRRPHAPGVWVVYFSLAALPVFGIGGWFVTDPVARARVFGLLVIYVASGMGLLLATSFLGLRRYLRQRHLQMPFEMTSTWIVVGSVMVCVMLLVAAILPRPEHSLTQVPATIGTVARKATKIAFGSRGIQDDKSEDPATTAARDGQKTERKGEEPGGKQGQPVPGKSEKSKDPEGKGKSKGTGKAEGGKNSKGGDEKGDQQAKSQESQGDASDQQRQSTSPEPGEPESKAWTPKEALSQASTLFQQLIGPLFRWLAVAALVCAGLGAAWVYREELYAAWQKLLAELRDLWNSWFGNKKQSGPTEEELARVTPPPRSFASFSDPFLTGEAARMSWPQLVRYSFTALEAWARDQGHPRAAGQTPLEFGQALLAAQPSLATDLPALVASYSELAYAPRHAASGQAESLRQLWFNLRSLAERRAA